MSGRRSASPAQEAADLATDLLAAWADIERGIERLDAMSPELARMVRQSIAADTAQQPAEPRACVEACVYMIDPDGMAVRLPLAPGRSADAAYADRVSAGWRFATAEETARFRRDPNVDTEGLT